MTRALRIYGMPVTAVSPTEAIQAVNELTDRPGPHLVVTPNTDHFLRFQRDPGFRELYELATYHFADGAPIAALCARAIRTPVQRVTGVDLTQGLVDLAASKGTPFAVIGGSPMAIEAIGKTLSITHPDLDLFLADSPSAADLISGEYHERVAKTINDTRTPPIVALCLGSPKQEEFYRALAPHVRHGVYLGVGATVDFLAGTTKRAPRWMQDNGIEWVYRMWTEPRRLTSRYARGARSFLPYYIRSLRDPQSGFTGVEEVS